MHEFIIFLFKVFKILFSFIIDLATQKKITVSTHWGKIVLMKHPRRLAKSMGVSNWSKQGWNALVNFIIVIELLNIIFIKI